MMTTTTTTKTGTPKKKRKTASKKKSGQQSTAAAPPPAPTAPSAPPPTPLQSAPGGTEQPRPRLWMHSDAQLFDATCSIGAIVAARNSAKYQLPFTADMNKALTAACKADMYSSVLCLTLPMDAFGSTGSLGGDLFVNPKHYNHEPDGSSPSGSSGDSEAAVLRLLADTDQGVTVHLRSVPVNSDGVPTASLEEENRAHSDGMRTITRSSAQSLLLLFAFLPFAPFVGIGRATDLEDPQTSSPWSRSNSGVQGAAPPLQALQALLEEKIGPQIRRARSTMADEDSAVFGRDGTRTTTALEFYRFLSGCTVDVQGSPFRPWPFFMETVRGGPGEAAVAVRFWQFVPTAPDGRDLAGESMAAVMKLSGQAKDAMHMMRAAIHGAGGGDASPYEPQAPEEVAPAAAAAAAQSAPVAAAPAASAEAAQASTPVPEPDLWFLEEPTVVAPAAVAQAPHLDAGPGQVASASVSPPPRTRFWTGETASDRAPRTRADVPIVPACLQVVANLINDNHGMANTGLIAMREQLLYDGDLSLDYEPPEPVKEPAQQQQQQQQQRIHGVNAVLDHLDIRRSLLQRNLAAKASLPSMMTRRSRRVPTDEQQTGDNESAMQSFAFDVSDPFANVGGDGAPPPMLLATAEDHRRKRQAILRATGCWALSPEHRDRGKRDDIAYAVATRTLYREDEARYRNKFPKRDGEAQQQQPHQGEEEPPPPPPHATATDPHPRIPADCIYHPTNLFPVEREISGTWTPDCARALQLGFHSYFDAAQFLPNAGGLEEPVECRRFRESAPTTFAVLRCKAAVAQAQIRWAVLNATGCDFPPMSTPDHQLAAQGLMAKHFKGFPFPEDVVFFDPVGCMPHVLPRLPSPQTLYEQPLFNMAVGALRVGTARLYDASVLEEHHAKVVEAFQGKTSKLKEVAAMAANGPHILRQSLQLLLVASQDYYVDAMHARGMQNMLIQPFRSVVLKSSRLVSHKGEGALCTELSDQEQMDRVLQAVEGLAKEAERTASFWMHDRKVLAFNAAIGFMPDMRIVANMQHGAVPAPASGSQFRNGSFQDGASGPISPLAAMATHVASDIVPTSLQRSTRTRYQGLFGSPSNSEITEADSYFATQFATHVCAEASARIDAAMRKMACVYQDRPGVELSMEDEAMRAYGNALSLALENVVYRYNMHVAQRLIDDPLLPMAFGDRQGLAPLLGKTFVDIIPSPFVDTGYGGVQARALFTMAAVDAMREIGGVRYVINTPLLILRTFQLNGWYTIGMGAERPMLILCGPPGVGKTFFTFVAKYLMPPGLTRQVTSLTAHALRVTCAIRQPTIFDDIEDDALRGGSSARGSNSTLKADMKHIGTTGALQIQQPNLHKPEGLRSGSSGPVKRDMQTSFAMYQGPFVINSNLRRRGDSGAEQQIDDAIASRALVPAAVCTTKESNIPPAASMRLAMMARPRGHELHEALGALSEFQYTSAFAQAWHTLVWVAKAPGVDVETASPVLGAILNNIDELSGRAGGGGMNSARLSGQLLLHLHGQVVSDAGFLIQLGKQGRQTRIHEDSGLPRRATLAELHQRMQPFAYPTSQQIALVVASAEDCFGIAAPRLLPDMLCSIAREVYGNGGLQSMLFLKEYVPLESAQYGVTMQQVMSLENKQSLVEAANLNYVIDENLSAPTLDGLYRKVASFCFRNQSLEEGAVKSLLDILQQQTVPLTRALDMNDPAHPPVPLGAEIKDFRRLGVTRLDIAAMEKLATETHRLQAAVADVRDVMGPDDDDGAAMLLEEEEGGALADDGEDDNDDGTVLPGATNRSMSRDQDVRRRIASQHSKTVQTNPLDLFSARLAGAAASERGGAGARGVPRSTTSIRQRFHVVFAHAPRIMQGVAVHEDDSVAFSNVVIQGRDGNPENGIACVNPIPENTVKRIPLARIVRDCRGYHLAITERVLRAALLERPMSCIDAAIQKAFSCSNLNCYPDAVVKIACQAAGGTGPEDTRMMHENATVKEVLERKTAKIFTTTPAVALSKQLAQEILGRKEPVDSNLAELVATQAMSTIQLQRTDKPMNLAVGMRPHGGVVEMIGRGAQRGLDKARPGILRALRVAAVNGTDASYADPGSVAPLYDFDFINMAAQALRSGGNPYSAKWVATLPIFSRDGNLYPASRPEPPVTWQYPEDPLRQYYTELKRNMDMEGAPPPRPPAGNREMEEELDEYLPEPPQPQARKRPSPIRVEELADLARSAMTSANVRALRAQGDGDVAM